MRERERERERGEGEGEGREEEERKEPYDIAKDEKVVKPLRVAIKRGVSGNGIVALWEAVKASGIDPTAEDALQQMCPIVEAYADGRLDRASKKKADEAVDFLRYPRPSFKVSALCVCLSLTHVHTQVSANRWCQSACCHRMLLQSSRLKKQASLLMLLQRLPFASSESGWWAFSSSRRPLQHT